MKLKTTFHTNMTRVLGLAAALALTGCGPLLEAPKAPKDFDLLLVFPASQVRADAPLPAAAAALIEPFPGAHKEPPWSPWPHFELVTSDAIVTARWSGADPFTDNDRGIGRILDGPERAARFEKQFAGKPLRELLTAVDASDQPTGEQSIAKSESTVEPESPATLALALAQREPGLLVLMLAPDGSSPAAKSEIPGMSVEMVCHSPDELRTKLAAALASRGPKTGKARATVLVWQHVPMASSLLTKNNPPASKAQTSKPTHPGELTLEPPSLPASPPLPFPAATPETSPVTPPAGTAEPTPKDQPVTVTHNTYYILPSDPPSTVSEAIKKDWGRLIKNAKPIEGCEFRFKFNKADLLEDHLAATKQYARDIATKHPGKKIIVAGYSDDVGSIKSRQEAAEKRAELVARHLRANGIEPLVVGFGEAPPDRGGPTVDRADREKWRVAIVYVVDEPAETTQSTAQTTTP